MNQLDNPASLADRLMMGPDGAVYVVQTGMLNASSPDDPSRACFRYSAEVPRRDGGEPPICFSYSAKVPRRDGGDPPVCFSYSVEAPCRGGGNPPVCFSYSPKPQSTA
jgi:hypothetical protein